jgi:hypothetical protein
VDENIVILLIFCAIVYLMMDDAKELKFEPQRDFIEYSLYKEIQLSG